MELELKTMELELELELKTRIEFFATANAAINSSPIISKEVIIFHVTDYSCSSCSWDTAPLWCGHKRHMGRVPCSP